MIRKLVLGLVIVLLIVLPVIGADVRRQIRFPDILGYKTLNCDFHMHTVFSDGSVWPTVRVDEAWREGLDAISITDHIEYQPHKKDIPTNHNRPYEIALPRAKEKNILLIEGAEITRDTPPGHFNAIYIDDPACLDVSDFLDAIRIANERGGFVFWNHPGWKPKFKGWFDVHTTLYEKGWLDGIEVANGPSYYPEAHQWCLEKNLAMIGASDIHAPSMRTASTSEDHRTMTLVFAKDRNVEAIKEALTKRRTAVWLKDQLIGEERYLAAIFRASLRVSKPHFRRGNTVSFEVANIAPMNFILERAGTHASGAESLPAGATVILKAAVGDPEQPVKVEYIVKNLLVGPDKPLRTELAVAGSR